MSEHQVLIIEDEMPIRRFLRAILLNHNYGVWEAANANDGMMQASSHSIDIVILDLGLPDMDGIDVIKRLREWSTVPIIIVSARGQESDKVAALDAGANDYLTKPFGVNELILRIRVALQHAIHNDKPSDPVFNTGDLHVDFAKRQVLVGENEIHLTPTEYDLLVLLTRHAGQVVTHNQLLRQVWGTTHAGETQMLGAHMMQLRHKIERDPVRPQYLVSELGVGYRLCANA